MRLTFGNGEPPFPLPVGGDLLGDFAPGSGRPLDAIALGDAPVWDPEPEIREKERQGLNGAVLRYLASARPEPDRWQEDYAPLFAAFTGSAAARPR